MIRVLPVLALLVLSGCASFGFKKTSQNTSVSFNSDSTQDIATLERSEYEVLGIAEGKAAARQVFILWFPVGSQKSRAHLVEDAYFKAAEATKDCDAVLLPRTRTKVFVVPALLVNVVSRKVTLQGRCIRMLKNDELPAPAAPQPPTVINNNVGGAQPTP